VNDEELGLTSGGSGPEHALIGKWVTEEEDSRATFTVALSGGQFVVTGEDEFDEEPFEITDVSWDGYTLRFCTRMPSTNHRAKHAFHLRPDGMVDHELTLFEVWKKVDASPE
jgi:hypothetical protein